jgi:hypothetical protein
MSAPNKNAENWGEMPQFRTLRRMVTLLTATLSIGVLVIAVALVYRITSEPGVSIKAVDAPSVTLPIGETIIATGATSAAITFVTRDGEGVERLRLFDPKTGNETDQVLIERR